MGLYEFQDHLFDAINECDALPVVRIDSYDRISLFRVFLSDGSVFDVRCSRAASEGG